MKYTQLALGLICFVPLSHAQVSVQAGASAQPSRTQVQTAHAGQGIVVSDSIEASRWGAEILKQGGNAMDAAIATAWALSVTRPHFASLGGGGFIVYCPVQAKSKCETLDYREVAPGRLPAGLKQAEIRTGAMSAAIPGSVAGLVFAQKRWGREKFARKIFDRPIALARDGVEITSYMEQSLASRAAKKEISKELMQWMGRGRAGSVVRNPGLAQLLIQIRARGAAAFYRGAMATALVQEVNRRGGFWRTEDLARYAPKLRAPVQSALWGNEVISMGPPSSGGVVLHLILQALATRTSLSKMGSLPYFRDYVRASALAFADRAQWLGDPDFVTGLLETRLPTLLDGARIERRMRVYSNLQDAKKQWTLPAPEEPKGTDDGDHTTHLSVIDAQGNAVALTTTINDSFGSGVFLPLQGIVLNNEMDDFSAEAGVANDFGLVGGAANAPAAGKRPLSSMTPTIVRRGDGGVIVLGAAGGPRIISAVAQTLAWRLKGGYSLSDAVAQPRIHHQWKPDELKVEIGALSPETRDAFVSSGLKVDLADGPLARLYAAERFASGESIAVADPRGEGQAAVIGR